MTAKEQRSKFHIYAKIAGYRTIITDYRIIILP